MSATVLFVDDEALVLESVKEISRSFDPDWKVSLALGGREALRLLEAQQVDIAVVDMHMPDYDGIRLLGHIRDHYPSISRIAMSGFATYESAMQAANAAHQFLHKPIGAERLRAMLQRMVQLRQTLADGNLKALIAKLDTLPSLPSLYADLIQEINSKDASIKRVGEIISRDMAMTAKILQLINSAFFGLPRKVSNTAQAVNLLGLQVIKALVLTIQIFQKFNGDAKSQQYVGLLFDHSVSTAALARRIAGEESQEQRAVDDAFLAALVHDVGKLILASQLSKQYRMIREEALSEERPVHLVEEDILGNSHAELGAYLLGLWGMPADIVEAVAFSHRPTDSRNPGFAPLTAVHAADAMVNQIRPQPELAGAKEMDAGYLERLGLADRVEVWHGLAQSLDL